MSKVTIDGVEYVPSTELASAFLGGTKPKRWKPEKGNGYWTIASDGGISKYTWGYSAQADEDRYALGNVYKTEEQAQAWVELQKHIFKFDEPEESEDSLVFYKVGYTQ